MANRTIPTAPKPFPPDGRQKFYCIHDGNVPKLLVDIASRMITMHYPVIARAMAWADALGRRQAAGIILDHVNKLG